MDVRTEMSSIETAIDTLESNQNLSYEALQDQFNSLQQSFDLAKKKSDAAIRELKEKLVFFKSQKLLADVSLMRRPSFGGEKGSQKCQSSSCESKS